jgi:hypothetical protein
MILGERATKVRRALCSLRTWTLGDSYHEAIDTLEDEFASMNEELLRASVTPPLTSLSASTFLTERLSHQFENMYDRVRKLEEELERLSAMHPKNSHPPHPAWHDRFRA